MDYLRQTIGSAALNNVFTLPQTLRDRTVEVLIFPVETADVADVPNYKCNVGFAKGADIPDSFFEPLSEEELQAWGL